MDAGDLDDPRLKAKAGSADRWRLVGLRLARASAFVEVGGEGVVPLALRQAAVRETLLASDTTALSTGGESQSASTSIGPEK